MLEKTCPSCAAKVHRTARKCDSCGHQFTKPDKAPRAPKHKPDPNEPEFACGPTSGDGFMLFWPRENICVYLKPEHLAILDRARPPKATT